VAAGLRHPPSPVGGGETAGSRARVGARRGEPFSTRVSSELGNRKFYTGLKMITFHKDKTTLPHKKSFSRNAISFIVHMYVLNGKITFFQGSLQHFGKKFL
jgi:hypothetical protein